MAWFGAKKKNVQILKAKTADDFYKLVNQATELQEKTNQAVRILKQLSMDKHKYLQAYADSLKNNSLDVQNNILQLNTVLKNQREVVRILEYGLPRGVEIADATIANMNVMIAQLKQDPKTDVGYEIVRAQNYRNIERIQPVLDATAKVRDFLEFASRRFKNSSERTDAMITLLNVKPQQREKSLYKMISLQEEEQNMMQQIHRNIDSNFLHSAQGMFNTMKTSIKTAVPASAAVGAAAIGVITMAPIAFALAAALTATAIGVYVFATEVESNIPIRY